MNPTVYNVLLIHRVELVLHSLDSISQYLFSLIFLIGENSQTLSLYLSLSSSVSVFIYIPLLSIPLPMLHTVGKTASFSRP